MGTEGLAHIATLAQVAVNGVVGFAGLPVTLAALEAGRRLALANKESIIAGAPAGPAVPTHAGSRADPGRLRALRHPPVPAGRRPRQPWPGCCSPPRADRSGAGPGRSWPRSAVADALAHPTWSMGPKITVDSSTLMNKGLEVIEAHELFGIPYDAIDVVVHPQSIVHSMVEFVDGAAVAQLSMPDMRLPIGYALAYPDRLPVAYGAIDWTKVVGPRVRGARPWPSSPASTWPTGPAAVGDLAPAWLNAANEVAVAGLPGRADRVVVHRRGGRGHPRPLRSTRHLGPVPVPDRSVADVLEADAAARRVAERVVAGREAA